VSSSTPGAPPNRGPDTLGEGCGRPSLWRRPGPRAPRPAMCGHASLSDGCNVHEGRTTDATLASMVGRVLVKNVGVSVALAVISSPGGCAPSEAEVKQELEAEVQSSNACAQASECVVASAGCPLACWALANAQSRPRRASSSTSTNQTVHTVTTSARRPQPSPASTASARPVGDL